MIHMTVRCIWYTTWKKANEKVKIVIQEYFFEKIKIVMQEKIKIVLQERRKRIYINVCSNYCDKYPHIQK